MADRNGVAVLGTLPRTGKTGLGPGILGEAKTGLIDFLYVEEILRAKKEGIA